MDFPGARTLEPPMHTALLALVLSSRDDLGAARRRFDSLVMHADCWGWGNVEAKLHAWGVSGDDARAVWSALAAIPLLRRNGTPPALA